MGIDFNKSLARWSYGGFNDFRRRLAQEIGIDLDRMRGFFRGEGKPLSWDKIKDDIVPLLNHSDCDGQLSPEECQRVAPRLRELMADWPDDDYDKQMGLLLAEGMAKCAWNGEPLIFS